MSQSKLKVAFLDRDGVINKNAAPHQFITRVGDFIFNKGIFEVLDLLKKQGFVFIVLSNQRGIALGVLTEAALAEIHSYMNGELAKRGIEILDIFYCPHDSDSCNCRKPKPGLMLQALDKYDINLAESIFVGDSQTDKDFADQFNLKCYLVGKDRPGDFLKLYRHG